MLFQWCGNTYTLKIHKIFLLLCVGFVILCSAMSAWQFYRYHFKKTLVGTYDARLKMLPQPFELIQNFHDLQFMPVAVDGEYEDLLTMFVQNKFYQGKPGYEVLTPIRMAHQHKLLLVDRGWVPALGSALPSITSKNPQQMTGYIKYLNEYQFILGENILESGKTPLVMQKIDISEISRLTKEEFYPFILRLDPESPDGFVRDWVIASVPPARHMMYALQWLAFAMIVIIAFFCFSVERVVYD